jgi:DNA-binding transcriptional LysR family regulator
MMDLSDLRIFTAVVREGGITRAANRLHRVQSSVTTRIKQLEDDLGIALFLRSGKKLHLTPQGQTLLGYADTMLALADEAHAAVRDTKPRGLFRLGAMESTASVRLPGPLSQFHKRHPDVTIELRTGNPRQLAAALLAGEIDAAFVAEPVNSARFESVPVFVEDMVLIAAKAYPAIGASDGTPSTMIAFEDGCPHRSRLEAWYARRNALPERIIEMSSYHAMLGCVLAGMGVALLPKSVLQGFAERRRLTMYSLPRGHDRVRTLLIWRKGTGSPKIDALLQAVRHGA